MADEHSQALLKRKLTPEEFAAVERLAIALSERNHPVAFRQMKRIFKYGGQTFAEELLRETLDIEANGGLLVNNGSRRRTPGGVYLYLARYRLPASVAEKIFPHPRNRQKKSSHKKAQPPAVSILNWDEREKLLRPLIDKAGKARTVKVVLLGRPERVSAYPTHVLLKLPHTAKSATPPRGVPRPELPPTSYTVYVTPKQWNKVEAALANPEDFLIVEGTCAYDEQRGEVVVYATSVNTKLLQAAQRNQTAT